MKGKLQEIEDTYIQKGYRDQKLREALLKDKDYLKIIEQRKRKLTKKSVAISGEKERYVLSTDDDLEILSLCKELESSKLSMADIETVKLIKSQLEYDRRKPLLASLKKLAERYK